MEIFGSYSDYYNLIYQDKDYLGESNYIDQLIQKFNPGSKTVLDLGCGTGKHDFNLAAKNYVVAGVDQSNSMLALARENLANLDPSLARSLSFHRHDIREVRLKRAFDVVISLFHVLSYQQTNEDLKCMVQTASEHLARGGIFIFDCWYGPGVLEDPPSARVKKVENDSIAVTRIAKPLMHRHQNRVDIFYYIIIKDKASNRTQEIRERHQMRYLFKPEVEFLLESCNFKLINFSELMKATPPGPGNWNACFVAQKTDA